MGETIQCLFLPHHHPTPPLLRLPGEIRNSIYRILLTYHGSINFAMRLHCHLILNKQIYAEARFILYTENDFAIVAPCWPKEGGIMKIIDRFKKEDVELIRAWTFQAQVCSRPTELPWLCIECLHHADYPLPGLAYDEPRQSLQYHAKQPNTRTTSVCARRE